MYTLVTDNCAAVSIHRISWYFDYGEKIAIRNKTVNVINKQTTMVKISK